MAIDKVREKHERWIKIAMLVIASIWLVIEVRNGLQSQRTWLEISRDVFFPIMTILALSPDFFPTPAFILTLCVLSTGLWLEANGFRHGIAFYKGFSSQGWLFLAGWLFYAFLTTSILAAWWRKRRTADAAV
jgi:hypothetical protein